MPLVNDEWVARRWGPRASVEVVDRVPVSGGYSSPSVERLDLAIHQGDGRIERVSVHRKRATEAEAAALCALREVDGASALPELLASGSDAGGRWVMMPFYPGRRYAESTVTGLIDTPKER